MTSKTTRTGIAGLLAEFGGAGELKKAADAVRQAGYRRFDVYTPYPVHGMDDAMGLGRSPLGWIVLVCGVSGALGALALQWYANAYEYPVVVSGKPYFAWQPFLVIIFEVMVGASALGAVFGMLALNGLPRWHHPLLEGNGFSRVSNDGFFLFIEAADSQFDPHQTAALLVEIGGKSIELIEG